MKHKTHIAYYYGRKKDNPKARWLDRVICFFTNSKYSHVELVYDFSEVSKIGLSWSSSPRDGGVRATSIDYGSGRWEVYEVMTDFTEDEIVAWCNRQNGKKYDWFGAIGSQFSFIRHNPKKWFCVSFIGACLMIPKSEKMTPQELFDYYGIYQRRVL